MSRRIMNSILQEMRYSLPEHELEELYKELVNYFGIVGGLPGGECKTLENKWNTPEDQKALRQYIKDWIEAAKRRKTTPREVAMAYA